MRADPSRNQSDPIGWTPLITESYTLTTIRPIKAARSLTTLGTACVISVTNRIVQGTRPLVGKPGASFKTSLW